MTAPKESPREALPEPLKVAGYVCDNYDEYGSTTLYEEEQISGFGRFFRNEPLVRLTDALSALESERQAHAAEVERLRADARRYRWLRMQDWFDGPLCVLRDPKRVLTRGIGLGADCPSRERLDDAIDQAIAKEKP